MPNQKYQKLTQQMRQVKYNVEDGDNIDNIENFENVDTMMTPSQIFLVWLGNLVGGGDLICRGSCCAWIAVLMPSLRCSCRDCGAQAKIEVT